MLSEAVVTYPVFSLNAANACVLTKRTKGMVDRLLMSKNTMIKPIFLRNERRGMA